LPTQAWKTSPGGQPVRLTIVAKSEINPPVTGAEVHKEDGSYE